MASMPYATKRLCEETRSHLPTAEAAFHLNRSEQTLRLWACKENGPLRPARIHKRLAWAVADLRHLLGA
ncbi:DNA-binding protein [Acidovorax sp.]|uniref:DNA-binding protein n=1 Tax=Acidovorax sp. TaxID=1872122 RepID=UPI0027B98207|nr:DNA-binding protein [Acidovorax sp.]